MLSLCNICCILQGGSSDVVANIAAQNATGFIKFFNKMNSLENINILMQLF